MTATQFKTLIALAYSTQKPISSTLYWINKDTNEYYVQREFGPRQVSIVQTQRYAFATEKDGKIVNSWGDYPKASEIEELDNYQVQVTFEFGKMIHDFSALKS